MASVKSCGVLKFLKHALKHGRAAVCTPQETNKTQMASVQGSSKKKPPTQTAQLNFDFEVCSISSITSVYEKYIKAVLTAQQLAFQLNVKQPTQSPFWLKVLDYSVDTVL